MGRGVVVGLTRLRSWLALRVDIGTTIITYLFDRVDVFARATAMSVVRTGTGLVIEIHDVGILDSELIGADRFDSHVLGTRSLTAFLFFGSGHVFVIGLPAECICLLVFLAGDPLKSDVKVLKQGPGTLPERAQARTSNGVPPVELAYDELRIAKDRDVSGRILGGEVLEGSDDGSIFGHVVGHHLVIVPRTEIAGRFVHAFAVTFHDNPARTVATRIYGLAETIEPGANCWPVDNRLEPTGRICVALDVMILRGDEQLVG